MARPSSVKRFLASLVMLRLLRFGGGTETTDYVYTRVLARFYWLTTISRRVIPESSKLGASAVPSRAGTPGSRERNGCESGIGKSSIWDHSPSSLGEPSSERLCSAAPTVGIDLVLDFGLGLVA